ncbi:hypothetical protein PRZ48_001584 [Zasmidium cellare]|uniref:Glycosyltransferase family 8 protein n=1 Tax=Zasmidium cellare TaxID=395010 RepID=A0ABR0F1M3_ZASCE|nr:hypothetical protein PRZ48_001584 [Zasmidium cellare]
MIESKPSPSPFRRWSTRRQASVYIAITIITFFLVVLPLPQRYDIRPDIVEQVTDIAKAHLPGSKYEPSSLETTKAKFAYATFLGPNPSQDQEKDINDDKYFVAARLLAYQLLHASETRTTHDYPFIVLVSEGVSEVKRERLRKDGAIVWERELVDAAWINTPVPGWRTVLTKLRLWELTQFDRICFLDGDTVLAKPLDAVFEDPAAAHPKMTDTKPKAIKPDEGPLPESYLYAGIQEIAPVHQYPPTEEHHDWPNYWYLNAGFFVMQPSLDVLAYYLSLLDVPNKFDAGLPEQNLLNYAHRPDGNMPWTHLDTKWNMHFVTWDDLQGGVHSLHANFWKPSDERLVPFLLQWRWRMEGFFEGRDRGLFGE